MIEGMSVQGAACTTKQMLLRNKYEKVSVISECEKRIRNSECEKVKRRGGVNRAKIVRLATSCRQLLQINSSRNYIFMILKGILIGIRFADTSAADVWRYAVL